MRSLVTVGMILRNCERFVGDAIDSVLAQDFPHELMEIVVVDDGSEDNTLDVVKAHVSKADIEAKIIHTEWRGLGPARHRVVENAKGDYIVWLDADEIFPADYVRKQVEYMRKDARVGITAGTVGLFTKNTILNLELIPAIVDRSLFEKPRTFVWKTQKLPGTGGATFRMKALKQVHGFDQRLEGVGEDQDVAKRIRDAGWLIQFNGAIFYETHNCMSRPKDLWRKYFWYGYGGYSLYRKNKNMLSLLRMSPVSGFVAGYFYSLLAYKLLHKVFVFLLPFHYTFKMIAWSLGFVKSQTVHAMSKKWRLIGKSRVS